MDNRLVVSGAWIVPILHWYPSSEKGIGQSIVRNTPEGNLGFGLMSGTL